MKVKLINTLFSSLVLLCLTSFGCGKTVLLSTWRYRPITIDGKYTDWDKSTAYYDETTKAVLNLANDAEYLYICLISRNREIETNIMEAGLTAWFDPDGGQKKEIGIRFPIGGLSIDDEKRDISRDWQDQEDKSGLIDREKERLVDKSFNKRLETLEGLQEKLEIVRGGVDVKGKKKWPKPRGSGSAPGDIGMNKPVELSLEEAGKFGIEAKVGRENDYFVYELKVPLTKSAEHIYAMEVKKDKPIGLGLEVGGFNADIPYDAMGDRMPPRRDRRESTLGTVNTLKLWFSVALFGTYR